jgi:cysteine desulfurase
MSAEAVFFDHNSTTTLDARVLEAMLTFLQHQQGNPASRHSFGRASRQAVEQAREQVAASVGAHPSQVTFTSGGTEADNLAVLGITMTHTPSQIAVGATEHPAVLRPAQTLQGKGWKLARIAVDAIGRLDLEHLDAALRHKTALLSVMTANNETGVMQDIAGITRVARRHGTLMHTDAVQALGKVELDFSSLGVHAMSLSAHKINGPQGVGALVLDKRVDIIPILYGGGQEKGLRSGTENIAAIVGFGMACELARQGLQEYRMTTEALRDDLERGLKRLGAEIFGQQSCRLPNTSFFAFPDIEGETLVMALDRKGYAVASGSACSSADPEPSHVLLAMGVAPTLARGAVRVSLGANNTATEVQSFLRTLENELLRLKQMTAMAV